MRKSELKLRGMDRIAMCINPFHKWNDITKSIEDPLDVFKRACGTTLQHIEDGNTPIQKATFGKTMDLIWLAQGIVEDLLVRLVNGKPGIHNWLRAINKAQEETLALKNLSPFQLRKIWGSKVLKYQEFLEEQKKEEK